MEKHSGGNANEALLRDLRLAVWRHKEPEGEFMVLSQIRQTLDHAGIAYDGCRLYRVQADNGECKLRVHPLTADGYWSPLTEGQQWVLGGVEISRDLLSNTEPPRRTRLAGPADALPCQSHPRNDL